MELQIGVNPFNQIRKGDERHEGIKENLLHC